MKFTSLLLWLMVLLSGLFSCTDATQSSNVFDPAKQAAADEEILKSWFAGRGLKDSVQRTSSGLYYRIVKSLPDSISNGAGGMVVNPSRKPVLTGSKVFVRYEGRLLSDTLFDSNMKSATSFSFNPGRGSTIKAWEEGLLKFKLGDEGYLYAPSGLGYGNISQNKIPANSCLVFFIRVVNVE